MVFQKNSESNNQNQTDINSIQVCSMYSSFALTTAVRILQLSGKWPCQRMSTLAICPSHIGNWSKLLGFGTFRIGPGILATSSSVFTAHINSWSNLRGLHSFQLVSAHDYRHCFNYKSPFWCLLFTPPDKKSLSRFHCLIRMETVSLTLTLTRGSKAGAAS